MDISTVFGGDSLKAADLQGNEPTVVISHVQAKEFDDGNKLVVSFEGKKKSLVCNKTNANRIAFMYGTETNGWIGKKITLYEEMVDFQGKLTPAIRVRAVKPASAVRQSSADMGRDDVVPPPQRQTGGMSDRAAMDDEIPF
jgi:hypothetical protein